MFFRIIAFSTLLCFVFCVCEASTEKALDGAAPEAMALQALHTRLTPYYAQGLFEFYPEDYKYRRRDEADSEETSLRPIACVDVCKMFERVHKAITGSLFVGELSNKDRRQLSLRLTAARAMMEGDESTKLGTLEYLAVLCPRSLKAIKYVGSESGLVHEKSFRVRDNSWSRVSVSYSDFPAELRSVLVALEGLPGWLNLACCAIGCFDAGGVCKQWFACESY